MVLLSMRGVAKRYGRCEALGGVDLDVAAGEIHALLGENGAGKSTLVNILAGLVSADTGAILMDGHALHLRSPHAATRAGIGTVHQHDALVDDLTVAENLALGERGGPRVLRRERLRADALAAARDAGTALPDPDRRAVTLAVGERQRVEFVRALRAGARLLVLDEPTAVLTPAEADQLLATTRALARRGVAVIFITHRLAEVRAHADRVSVLRHGRVVATYAGAAIQHADLARDMVGDAAPDLPEAVARQRAGALVLSVRGLALRRPAGGLDGIDLELRAGEVLGVAGVDGNGQGALCDVLFGLARPDAGAVSACGGALAFARPGALRALGAAIIPADRATQGLAPSLSIAENLHLSVRALAAVRHPLPRNMLRRAAALCARFALRADARAPAHSLSGGNQQRVVLARELDEPLPLLVLAQPTRGLDVAAAHAVHAAVLAARARGAAVLLVSTDLDEVLALSDRVLVLFRGRVQAQFPRGAARREVGLALAGAHA